jgi:hypothetical protein
MRSRLKAAGWRQCGSLPLSPRQILSNAIQIRERTAFFRAPKWFCRGVTIDVQPFKLDVTRSSAAALSGASPAGRVDRNRRANQPQSCISDPEVRRAGSGGFQNSDASQARQSAYRWQGPEAQKRPHARWRLRIRPASPSGW